MWIVRLALQTPLHFRRDGNAHRGAGLRRHRSACPPISFPISTSRSSRSIWSYSGIAPEEMADVVTIRCERSFTTRSTTSSTRNRSRSPASASSGFSSSPTPRSKLPSRSWPPVSQSVLHSLPVGMTPPSIIRYNASSVPILQLGLSSDTMSEQALYDYGYNFIRTQLSTVQGASFPLPYGGKPRQIMVDLDPEALFARNISPGRIAAINNQSIILPSGTVKIGPNEYSVKDEQPGRRNRRIQQSAHQNRERHHHLRQDVAHVRDGSPSRPTSSATTDGAARCSPCSRTARPPRSTSSAGQNKRCRASFPRCPPR